MFDDLGDATDIEFRTGVLEVARPNFSGTAGQVISLTVNTSSGRAGTAYVYKPDMALLTNGSVNGTNVLNLGTADEGAS